MPITKALRRIVILATLALAGACASGPSITRDTNPEARFGTYRTFGFYSPLATDQAGYESLVTSRLKDSTRRAMESKGYVYQQNSPDLLLNFFVNLRDRQELVATSVGGPSVGYYGYRRGRYSSFGAMTTVETVNYKEGTLTIDLVEAQRKVLVWHATAEGSVSDKMRKNPGPAIDAVVTKAMEPLSRAASGQ